MIHGHIGKLFLRIPQLQYMYLSLGLITIVKMNSWLSKFALLLKAGTFRTFTVDFVSQLCFDRKS